MKVLKPLKTLSKLQSSPHEWVASYEHHWTSAATPAIIDSLRIFTLTWNMHGRRSSLHGLLPRGHHIYAVTTQECLHSVASSLFRSSKAKWTALLQSELGSEYSLVASNAIGATHLVIFVHYTVLPWVSCVEQDKISTGFVNLLNNKGAVAVSFLVKTTSILFIGCHLAAGQKSRLKRQNDFARVSKQLGLLKSKQLGKLAADLADACVFMGDFNFRLALSRTQAETLIKDKALPALTQKDEFALLQQRSQLAASFYEGVRKFPPTYKLDVGTSCYDSSSKQRVPAWTDRVLYKSKSRVLIQESYDAIFTNTQSDHRPVYAEFRFYIE